MIVNQDYELSLWVDVAPYEYKVIELPEGTNPHAAGYFEKIDGEYVVTEDTSVDPEKTYYRATKIENKRFSEDKICILASPQMTSRSRATDIVLTRKIDGTNNLTFKLYLSYFDEEAGQVVNNPFVPLCMPERRVKLKWLGEWYEMVITKCQEDSKGRTLTCTCQDSFINELSKNGYNVELNTELMNSTGTAYELAKKVMENTDWIVNEGETILESHEESVFEVVLNYSGPGSGRSWRDLVNNEPTALPDGAKILVYYDDIIDIQQRAANGQPMPTNEALGLYFWYAPSYETEVHNELVLNGAEYKVAGKWTQDGDILTFTFTNSGLKDYSFNVRTDQLVSNRYRAKRFIQSYKQVYSKALNRYVYEYHYNEDPSKLTYGYTGTKFADANFLINFLGQGENFTDQNPGGWKPDNQHEGSLRVSQYPLSDLTDVEETGEPPRTFMKWPAGVTVTSTALTEQWAAYLTNGITKGDKFVLYLKACRASKDQPNGRIMSTASEQYLPSPYVKDEDKDVIAFAKEEWKNYRHYNSDGTPDGGVDGVYCVFTSKYTYTQDDLKNTTFSFKFLSKGVDIWVGQIEFFKYAVDSHNHLIRPGEYDKTAEPKINYLYADNLISVSKPEKIQYVYEGEKPWSEVTYNYEGEKGTKTFYEKRGTVEAKESNRFNILQQIAETFEAWCRFKIYHADDGHIQIVDGKPQKYIEFVNQIGTETGLCFQYGLDLTAMSRDVVSDAIVTKTIVKANVNECAPRGICDIAEATENYNAISDLYNFDYYINQGLIDADVLNYDLTMPISDEQEDNPPWIAFYPRSRKYAIDLMEKSNERANILATLDTIDSELNVAKNNLSATQAEINRLKTEIATFCGITSYNSIPKWKAKYPQVVDWETYQKLQPEAKPTDWRYKYWSSFPGGPADADNSLWGTILALSVKERELKDISNQVNDLQTKSDEGHSAIDGASGLDKAIEADKKKLKKISDQFFKKYSHYVKEGVWQDDKYFDPDKYYLDAKAVAYESAHPKISYLLTAMRVASLEDFRTRVFNLGDICYVQDTEFFGWTDSTRLTPYREKVLISEITYNILNPSKDSFKLQNYHTQFDDLFQRITAATQTLTFSKSSYDKASNAVNANGTIKAEYLQDTLNQNKNLIRSTYNDTIVEDGSGIHITSRIDPMRQTIINSSGIFVTKDGVNWQNALNSDGISTGALSSGVISTNKIAIQSGDTVTFRWDEYGISAFALTHEEIEEENPPLLFALAAANEGPLAADFGTYVRMDEYGLYGIQNKIDFKPTSQEDVWNTAKFGLTWDGFFLRSNDDNNSVEISSNNDIQVKQNGEERVKIGRIFDKNGLLNGYGMQLRNDKNQITLETNNYGQLWLRDVMSIGSTPLSEGEWVQTELREAGGSPLEDSEHEELTCRRWYRYDIRLGYFNEGGEDFARTISVNDNFIVWEDGSIFANNGEFTGTIHAIEGEFGDITTGSYVQINDNGLTAYNGGLSVVANNEKVFYFNQDNSSLFIKGNIQLGREATGILLNSDKSTIVGQNWSINPNFAEFNNINVTGKITTAVFEKKSISAVGGSMIYRPAYKVVASEKLDFYTVGTVTYSEVMKLIIDNEFGSGINNWIYMVSDDSLDESGNYVSAMVIDVQPITDTETIALYPEGVNIIYVDRYTNNTNDSESIDWSPVSVIDLGKSGGALIGVNAADSRVGYLEAEGFTISTISSEEKLVDKDKVELLDSAGIQLVVIGSAHTSDSGELATLNYAVAPSLFMGNLDLISDLTKQQFDDSLNISGYGLYADNVYLNGTLVTKTRSMDETNYYTGVNTGSTIYFDKTSHELPSWWEDESEIIFWGGSNGLDPEDIQKSSFIVTREGSLYANKGFFEGPVLTKSEITATKFYGSAFYPLPDGDEDKPGLSIYDTARGIEFKRASDDSTLFRVNSDQLAILWKEALTGETKTRSFINLNTADTKQIQFIGDELRLLKLGQKAGLTLNNSNEIGYADQENNMSFKQVFNEDFMEWFEGENKLARIDGNEIDFQTTSVRAESEFNIGRQSADGLLSLHWQPVKNNQNKIIGYSLYVQ